MAESGNRGTSSGSDSAGGEALDPQMIAGVAKELAQAQSVLFITGAGISADSGLPTYRGVGGLYNQDDTEDGIPIEMALSGPMFEMRPELTWKYIQQIESACRGARYNRAHEIMAALEERKSRVWVLTQNVDGFHVDAGSQNVIEIHGSVRKLRCTACRWAETVASYEGLGVLPRCPECSSVVRPDVVLFGEQLAMDKLNTLGAQLHAGFDIVFSVGTTSVFPYIASPILRANAAGRPTVEINPGQSEVSEVVRYRLRAGASHALEAVWRAYLANHPDAGSTP